jgi:hypothetical protein
MMLVVVKVLQLSSEQPSESTYQRPGVLRTIGGSPDSNPHHVKILRQKRQCGRAGATGIESSREVPHGNSSLPIPWCQFPPPISFPSRTGTLAGRPSPTSRPGVPKIGHFVDRSTFRGKTSGTRGTARRYQNCPFSVFLFFWIRSWRTVIDSSNTGRQNGNPG